MGLTSVPSWKRSFPSVDIYSANVQISGERSIPGEGDVSTLRVHTVAAVLFLGVRGIERAGLRAGG